MATERDVIVRLKVQRADGQALADVAKKTKEAADHTERIPRAMRQAADQSRRITGGGGAGTSGVGASGDFSRTLAIGRAFAYLKITEGFLTSVTEAIKVLGREALTTKGKIETFASAIPIFGQIFQVFHAGFSELSGRARIERADISRASGFEFQAGNEQLLAGAERQRREIQAGAFGQGPAGLASELARARGAAANAFQQVQSLKLKTAEGQPFSLAVLAEFGGALRREKTALEDLMSVQRKQLELEKQRVQGAVEFALLPAQEQISQVNIAKRALAGERVLKEEFEQISSSPLFARLREMAGARAALDNTAALREAQRIGVQIDLNAEKLTSMLADKLNPKIRELIENITITSGNEVLNQIEERRRQIIGNRSLQNVGQ